MTMESGTLRAWMVGLDDTGLRNLLMIPSPLPHWAKVANARRGGLLRLKKRELLTVRAWLNRASARALQQVADAAADFAWLEVTRCECRTAPAGQPGAEELRTMLDSLDPVLARLTLHSLIAKEGAKQADFEQNWDLLTEASARPGITCSCGEGKRMSSARDPDAGPCAVGETTSQDAGIPREEERNGGQDSVAENETCAPGGDGLADQARLLRSLSAPLAVALHEAAERVSDGLELPESLWEEVSGWSAEREKASALVRAAGLSWGAHEGFAAYDDLVEELHANEQERAARAEKMTRLQEERALLQRLVERAGQGDEGEYPEALRTSLRALEQQIVELTDSAPPAEPSVAAPTDEPTSPTGDSSSPSVDDVDDPPVTHAQPEDPAADNVEHVEVPSPRDEETRSTDAPISRPEPQTSGAEPGPRTPGASERTSAAPRHAGSPPPAPSERLSGDEAGQTDQKPGPQRLAPATGPEDTPDDEDVYLPWQATEDETDEEAATSPMERLVSAGRLQEAYWLTVASTEPAHRAECVAFAEAAFSCDVPEEATPVMMRFTPDLGTLNNDRPALVLAAVASLRAGLVAGWPNECLQQTDLSSVVPGPWGKLLECAVDALRRFQPVDPATLRPSGDSEPTLTRAGVGAQAADLAINLPQRRIGYVRATQVQNRLMGAEEPLGRALAAMRRWADGRADAAELDEAWEVFRKRDSSARMIEEADAAIRTPKQAKEPIEAKAKRALLSRIDSVATLLVQARALASPGTEGRSDTVTSLVQAVAQVKGIAALPGVEGAALLRLRAWLLGEDRSRTPRRAPNAPAGGDEDGESVTADLVPGTEALLAAGTLPRDSDGSPLPNAPGFARAVASLLEPVDIRGVLITYAERGDLHLADALVDAMERGLVPTTPEGPKALPTDWRARRDTEWAQWLAFLRDSHRAVVGLLAELRTQQSLDKWAEQELTGRLERLEQPSPPGAFRATVEEIRRLEEELRERIQAYVTRLHEQLETLTLSEPDRRRLTGLLDAGDTVTAEECLALLRKGDTLPDWSSADSGQELASFMAGLKCVTPVKAGQQGYSARPWAEWYADGDPLTDGARIGLDSWDALSNPTTRGSEWQKHVPTVLRMLGLEGRAPDRDERRQVRGVLRLTAKLNASEAATGYVAALGSAATTYTVLVISDEQRGRSPLDLLDSSERGACVILYMYPLGQDKRQAMAMRARTSAQQALVVDPAVFGWIAARSPRSFRAVQRVTLPWTAFNPYTPFVAGLVPPEVFYGRAREMAEVMDPLGAVFLYGGRQLGKSALLRKVEADFPTHPHHKAVYLDLKARGVGEAEPAERIWSVLASELKRVGVLGPKVSTEGSADVLLNHVQRWLEGDRERRILVLADEADAFLTADSKAVHGRGGDGTFANVARLKGLMDRTDRRFKIVFAGLHQVQRFSSLSNTPLAHGGPEVLIGPLQPSEAQRLIVEPMAAFGYRFERPELVWRMLAATNYQACLVQILCEKLVTALRGKSLSSAQWPIMVTEADVRAVTGSAHVHRNIAERLRLTINLEDRYRVLALVIALRSQADGFQRGYDADQLLGEAKAIWPEGFRDLTASDVKIYLDEMEGLGLLILQADQRNYAVRSPNVVHMLGTREDLELELRQTEFSLPYDYNPRFSRRLIGQDRDGVARYSPLTEHQLREAISSGITAVCLTEAHRPELVSTAIRSFADARGLTVHSADPTNLTETLTSETRSQKPGVVLVDLRACGLDTLSQAMDKVHARTTRKPDTRPPQAAVLLFDPRARTQLQDQRIARVLRPERWNADSLRAWPECPFDTPDKRRRLVEATGGWPSLVERTVDLATRGGATLEAALQQIQAHFSQQNVANHHLQQVELGQRTIDTLVTWVQYIEPGYTCDHADIEAVTDLDLAEVHDLTAHLTNHGVLDDGEGGYALDQVTFRALVAAQEQ